ncbi:MAG: BON domain-containing protein [Alphaproteobacteria bacterium]
MRGENHGGDSLNGGRSQPFLPRIAAPIVQFSRKGAPQCARDLRQSTAADAPDAGLRRAILAAFTSEPRLKTRSIGVSVEGGRVTLSGYVTSHAQKDAAGAAARRVKGVVGVTDTLSVAVPCAEGRSFSEIDVGRPTLTLSAEPERAPRVEPASTEADTLDSKRTW